MSADDKKDERAAVTTSGMPDLNALRLPQDFSANLGVKKLLVQVPVTKPRKGWFVAHRGRVTTGVRTVAMIERKEEGEKLRRQSGTRMPISRATSSSTARHVDQSARHRVPVAGSPSK